MSEFYVYEDDDIIIDIEPESKEQLINLNKNKKDFISSTNYIEKECLQKIQKLNVSTVHKFPNKIENIQQQK